MSIKRHNESLELPDNRRLSNVIKIRPFEIDEDLIKRVAEATGHEETSVKRLALHFGLEAWAKAVAA